MRSATVGIPWWNSQGRKIDTGERKLFGENDAFKVCPLLDSRELTTESIHGVTSDISITRFEYSTSPRAISRFFPLKCYLFTWYILCDNYCEEIILLAQREDREDKYDVTYKVCVCVKMREREKVNARSVA